MSRRLHSLTVLCCLAASLATWVALPAMAQEEPTEPVVVTPTTPGTLPGEVPVDVTPVTPEPPIPGVEPEPQPAVEPAEAPLLPKADIIALLNAGETAKAEAAYFTWAAFWQEEDPVLLYNIERTFFLQEYRDGDISAIVELAKVGDRQAISLLTSLILSGGAAEGAIPPAVENTEAYKAQLAEALRIVGATREPAVINPLLLVVKTGEPLLAYAALDGLALAGDSRVNTDLLTLLDGTDAERTVMLARTLTALGAGAQVRARFLPQLRFPKATDRAQAALALAVAGDASGWLHIYQMVTTKDEAYYPLVLSVLGTLPSKESEAFVTQALLTGSELEQTAALKSLGTISRDKLDTTLMQVLNDKTQPVPTRKTCVEVLAKRRAYAAARYLTVVATGEADDDAVVKNTALTNLSKFGALRDPELRGTVRSTVAMAADAAHQRAARLSLLQYAVSAMRR